MRIVLSAFTMLSQVQADIAKKSQNPISKPMSLPLQYNYDSNIGPICSQNIQRGL